MGLCLSAVQHPRMDFLPPEAEGTQDQVPVCGHLSPGRVSGWVCPVPLQLHLSSEGAHFPLWSGPGSALRPPRESSLTGSPCHCGVSTPALVCQVCSAHLSVPRGGVRGCTFKSRYLSLSPDLSVKSNLEVSKSKRYIWMNFSKVKIAWVTANQVKEQNKNGGIAHHGSSGFPSNHDTQPQR